MNKLHVFIETGESDTIKAGEWFLHTDGDCLLSTCDFEIEEKRTILRRVEIPDDRVADVLAMEKKPEPHVHVREVVMHGVELHDICGNVVTVVEFDAGRPHPVKAIGSLDARYGVHELCFPPEAAGREAEWFRERGVVVTDKADFYSENASDPASVPDPPAPAGKPKIVRRRKVL